MKFWQKVYLETIPGIAKCKYFSKTLAEAFERVKYD
jgi:hypothetical protein